MTLGAILVLNIFSGTPTSACSPAPYDKWYKEAWIVDPATLPPGVSMSTVASSTEPYIFVRNTSDTPFYIVRSINIQGLTDAELKMRQPDKNSEVPAGTEAYLKLFSDRAFQYYIGSSRYEERTDSGGFQLSSQDIYLPNVERINIASGPPPSTDTIPNPTQFTYGAYYGDQLITIKGTINYERNDTFIPYRGDGACGGGSGGNSTTLIVIGSTTVLLFSGLVLWAFRKKTVRPAKPGV